VAISSSGKKGTMRWRTSAKFYEKGNFPQGKIKTVIRANTDLFEIKELNSKKVKDICDKNNIKNFALINIY
jgi:hypothetical protein